MFVVVVVVGSASDEEDRAERGAYGNDMRGGRMWEGREEIEEERAFGGLLYGRRGDGPLGAPYQGTKG